MPIARCETVQVYNNYQLPVYVSGLSGSIEELSRQRVLCRLSLSANDYLLSVSTVTVIAVCPNHPGQVLHGCNFLE